MNKKMMKRAVVMLSAAAMALAGTSMMTASASATEVEFKMDTIQVLASEAAGKTVDYAISIKDAQPWASAGFKFSYDQKLTLTIDPDAPDDVLVENGEATPKMTISSAHHPGDYSLTFSRNSTVKKDGQMAIVHFTLPADAKAGDKYEIIGAVTKFGDDETNPVPFVSTGTKDADGYSVLESGYIEVVANPVVTTATTAATTAGSEATTAAPTTKTTATTTAAPVKSPNTGASAGAALALVGLMTAAGAAVVLKKKN